MTVINEYFINQQISDEYKKRALLLNLDTLSIQFMINGCVNYVSIFNWNTSPIYKLYLDSSIFFTTHKIKIYMKNIEVYLMNDCLDDILKKSKKRSICLNTFIDIQENHLVEYNNYLEFINKIFNNIEKFNHIELPIMKYNKIFTDYSIEIKVDSVVLYYKDIVDIVKKDKNTFYIKCTKFILYMDSNDDSYNDEELDSVMDMFNVYCRLNGFTYELCVL